MKTNSDNGNSETTTALEVAGALSNLLTSALGREVLDTEFATVFPSDFIPGRADFVVLKLGDGTMFKVTVTAY